MGNFVCSRCGSCCKSICKLVISAQCACNEITEDLHPILLELAQFPYTINEDTGCCPKLDQLTNLCTVYYDRPLVCRVEEMWIRFWSDVMTHDEWIQATKESCRKLQGKNDSAT